jgi:PAS domain S-box-containing protein
MRSTQPNNTLKQQIVKRRQAEKKLELSEEHFHLLVEGVKDYAIFFMDSEGIVRYWNKGARHLLGFKGSEVIGKSFSRFFIKEDRKALKPEIELKTAIEKGSAGDENWLLRKNKTRFWASGVTTAVKDKKGNIIYLAKIIHDLTFYKELEERKDEFISMASHELKTPVTSIQAFIQILQKRSEGLEDQLFNQVLKKTGAQLTNLTLLIDDLLSVAKIQAGRLEIHQNVFDFDELIQEEIENFQATTQTHKLILQGKTNQKVTGDKYRIGQVVLNLLTNATKYSPNSDQVIIKLSKNKEHVNCSVIDFGIGISKENQKKVFDRFFRASGKDEKTFPGIGLGLYIANEIIQRHRGKLYSESIEDKGSTFSFRLPVLKKEQLKPKNNHEKNSNHRR